MGRRVCPSQIACCRHTTSSGPQNRALAPAPCPPAGAARPLAPGARPTAFRWPERFGGVHAGLAPSASANEIASRTLTRPSAGRPWLGAGYHRPASCQCRADTATFDGAREGRGRRTCSQHAPDASRDDVGPPTSRLPMGRWTPRGWSREPCPVGTAIQPAPKKSPASSGATMESSSAGESTIRSAPAARSIAGSCHPQDTPSGVTPASRASRMSPAVSPTYQ
jgi:hypothetical protein